MAAVFKVSRDKPNSKKVASTITLLYILSVINCIQGWYTLNTVVLANGSTRQTMFMATIDVSSLLLIFLSNFVAGAGFVVSDALFVSHI